MHAPEIELHERGLCIRLQEESVGILPALLCEIRAPMGDGKVLDIWRDAGNMSEEMPRYRH